MHVLVVGGAGYVGSHMVRALVDAGVRTTVLDDLSTGFRDAVDPRAEFVRGDVGDAAVLDALFVGRTDGTPDSDSRPSIDGVLHFAGRIAVGESVRDPALYWRENVAKSLVLLDAMARHGVGRLVFSSSAAVYGEPETLPIPEDHALAPVSPYGWTKRVVEQAIRDHAHAHGLNAALLRYFNAAGAHPDGTLAERHDPETHLVPIVLEVARGDRPLLSVFGTDWPTRDGSCVRDYVHVCDLADAHLAALHALADAPAGTVEAFNLGSSEGHTVLEVVEAVRAVTGHAVPTVDAPRRDGDTARLVADATKARTQLGWAPKRSAIETLVADAHRALSTRADAAGG